MVTYTSSTFSNQKNMQKKTDCLGFLSVYIYLIIKSAG